MPINQIKEEIIEKKIKAEKLEPEVSRRHATSSR